MSTMSCAEFGNVASELALGVLYGEERAAALAHVETCRGCRRELTLLTDAADEHPWTVELDENPNSVAAVSIVDNGGTVWCTARFE